MLPTAATIVNSLQEAGELLSQNLEFFKNVHPSSYRSETFAAADLANRDRKIPLRAADLERIFRLQTVRLGGDDGRATSRAMVTPDGVLWNLSRELEDRYLELETRVRQSRPPTKYRHAPPAARRDAATTARIAASNNPANATAGTPSYLPALTSTLRSAAMASKTQKLAAQIAADSPPGGPDVGNTTGAPSPTPAGTASLDDTAAAYLNQWVMPSDQPIGSSTRGETAAVGAPGIFASHAVATAASPHRRPDGRGGELVGGGITLAEMERLGAFTAELLDGYIVQGGGVAEGGAGGGKGVEEVEREVAEARRSAERLEKQLNALVRRNRKLVGGH